MSSVTRVTNRPCNLLIISHAYRVQKSLWKVQVLLHREMTTLPWMDQQHHLWLEMFLKIIADWLIKATSLGVNNDCSATEVATRFAIITGKPYICWWKISGFPSSIKRSNITCYVDKVPDPSSGAGAWTWDHSLLQPRTLILVLRVLAGIFPAGRKDV